MRISLNTSHLSIVEFPTIEVPDFTLITGQNGVGKSHLLQGLVAGALITDCTPRHHPNQQTEIRLFDWSTLVPNDTGIFTSETLKQEHAILAHNLENLRRNTPLLEPLRAFARRLNLPSEFLQDISRVATLREEEIVPFAGSVEQARQYKAELEQVSQSVTTNFMANSDENMRRQLLDAGNRRQKPIFALNSEDLSFSTLPSWGRTDLFQQSFARLFVAYRDLYLTNELVGYRNSKGHKNEVALSPEEFVALHGPPPWEFVNDSLASAGLDFEINRPNLTDYDPFQPVLTKKSKTISIPFANLSSGEKILMSFAFCLYYANDRRQMSSYPKLLLFDEIDAPLHPSMTKNLIDTITKTLVGSFGIKVIATTHSPSTVALAPEDAVHLMQAGRPGLNRTTKAQALNVLTVGVPTLAISFEGRRQVFVESPADAATYDAVYRVLRSRLGHERSLEFIPTGSRSASGAERNTGCEIVKRIVSDLAAAGNNSVFGLLDWDGTNQPQGRVYVLAEHRRNGLENVLFDPLLLASLLYSRGRPDLSKIGAPSSESYVEFLYSGQPHLQTISGRVAEAIFKSPATALTTSNYFGGLTLNIDDRYVTTDDHLLEEMILEVFPSLNAVSRGRPGKMMQEIIATVLADRPEFIPSALVDLFRAILDAPAHPEKA